uniref:OSJNBa0029L02.8 protein n=1 Tax=Oryza sativa subsp. japonica TaxID=39947 RepID=Q7XMS9_ORYSJ|nr:OSJNBa0029L02.8 [Oryza sativa Japonica Group]
MGHPRLQAGPARPDSWWAVPGREAQPMGRHGPARSANRAVQARWLVGRAWPCLGRAFWPSILPDDDDDDDGGRRPHRRVVPVLAPLPHQASTLLILDDTDLLPNDDDDGEDRTAPTSSCCPVLSPHLGAAKGTHRRAGTRIVVLSPCSVFSLPRASRSSCCSACWRRSFPYQRASYQGQIYL